MACVKRKFFIRSIFGLGILVFSFSCAASNGMEPEVLTGKNYSYARKILIKGGWVPVRESGFEMMEWEKDIKRKYPELEGCAIDKPFCSFVFEKPGKCVRVITRGEDVKNFVVRDVAHDCLNGAER